MFLVFINYHDNGTINWILKFADDTKFFSKISHSSDVHLLQLDLDKHCAWSQDLQIAFNVEKCKEMYIGNKNLQSMYFMDGKDIGKVNDENDLEVYMASACQSRSSAYIHIQKQVEHWG